MWGREGAAGVGSWHLGSMGKAWESPEYLLSRGGCLCQSSGFLRPGARLGRPPGAGLPWPWAQGVQQECVGFTGLLQHGRRASVPGTGWCTRQSTQVCTPCVRACVHVRAHP